MFILNLSVCTALWVITIWRALGAWRHKEKRPLWTAFFLLAFQMCFANDSAARWLDETTGINSVSALVKHSSAVAAASFVLDFLAQAAACSSAVSLSKSRLRAGVLVPAATLATMVALFAIADRPQEAVDLILAYPRDPWVLLYVLTWTTYFGWVMLRASWLSWQWSRRPGPATLQRGLGLIGLGTSIGIVYAVHRASMIIFSGFDIHPIPTGVDSVLNALLALVPLLLISVGSTLPTYPKARAAVQYRRFLIRLHLFWEHLSEAAPQIRYGRTQHPLRDVLDPRGIRNRLYRRTIEIRDAILILNSDAPISVRLAAADFVDDAGLTGPNATTTAEACWLRATREARTTGVARAGSPEAPAQAGADLKTEAELLLKLSDAYFSDLATEFAKVHLERLNTAVSGATS